VGHLLFPLVLTSGANLALQHGTLLLGMSAPFALWLLAQVHFDDAFRPRPGHWVLLAVAVGIGYLSWLGVVERRIPGAWFSPANADFWQVAPRLVSLALVAHALIRVYVGAGSDLVLARLRLRYALLLVAGTYMLIELLAELLLRDSPSARIADTLHSALVLMIVFGASLMTLRSSPEALRPVKLGLDGPAADPALLDRLRRLMEEGAYRHAGLTIRDLAGGRARAGVPLSPLRAHRSRGHREDHRRASTPRCLPVSCSPPGRLKKRRDRSKLVTQRRTQARLRRGAAEFKNGMHPTSGRRRPGWTPACR
jgi:hypothetical protein